MNNYENDLIYGTDKTEKIVSVEVDGENLVIFQEIDGKIIKTFQEAKYWLLTNRSISPQKEYKLEGNQFFKYYHEFSDSEAHRNLKSVLYKKRIDFYNVSDLKESNLLRYGMTYFKGLEIKDVSVLSFDIESDSLVKHKNSEIYIITNTFRKQNEIIRKIFTLDQYDTQAEMLKAWCDWVQEMDPSLVIGHNIFGYDFPYLQHVAQINGVSLKLGRDGSELKFNTYESKFRKDGSQTLDYFNVHIYGREIVDTMFLSVKYDIGRAFPSYGLKPIIKFLGMEKADRTFIDAGKMKEIYYNRIGNPELWVKSKQYGEEDSDDALKLFDLMVPSFFYMTQSISMSFQQIINKATGSQINNMMVRAYFQDGHSIAKADEATSFEGALSLGVPGEYKNCVRWDIASLYPSIMRQYKVYNTQKDPKGYFLQLVENFTVERLKNKQLAKETNNKYYKDLEGSQKILINSKYGALGAPGLNYNYPEGAAFITKKGREILGQAIEWASGKTVDNLFNRCYTENNEEV